jgi:hypothetical protein
MNKDAFLRQITVVNLDKKTIIGIGSRQSM